MPQAMQTGSTLPPGIGEAYIDGILEHSTEIIDPGQDWIVTGHEEDNHVIYPVDFGDINNLKIGLDDQYLFIKLTMNGTFPEEGGSFPVFDRDQLHKYGFDLRVDTDNNNRTGCLSDNGAEFMTGYGIAYENGQIHTNWISYSTDPTGTETSELARYKNTVFTNQLQFGGVGHDYFSMAIPLSPLRITRGQEITINAWVEISSDRYDHASFDILCPGSLPFNVSSLACPIEIRLGEERIIK